MRNRRSLLLACFPFAVACHDPPAPVAAPAPVAVVVADAGESKPVTPAEGPEEGVLYTGNETVARGDTTIADGRAIFRDAKEQLRARPLTPRETHGTEQRPIRMALGDRVIYGPWDVRWVGVREGLVRFEGRRRGTSTGEWSTSTDERIAEHDLETRSHLFTFQVRLVATSGRLDHGDGSVEITGRASDLAAVAKLGDRLAPGVFAFPDGLRLHVERGDGCDFDASVPCPFGGTYNADAALGELEAHVVMKTKETKILGHTIELLAIGAFRVRK